LAKRPDRGLAHASRFLDRRQPCRRVTLAYLHKKLLNRRIIGGFLPNRMTHNSTSFQIIDLKKRLLTLEFEQRTWDRHLACPHRRDACATFLKTFS
jgi:hypothetical protein